MQTIERYGPLVGRILIALIFVWSGFGKIVGFEATVGYIASKGLPLPQLGTIAAILVELGGGLMLIFGFKARCAAAAMFVFTAMAALIFHDFWAVPPEQALNQMIHFMKNVSMMGGLLFVVVYGSGPLSLENTKR
ncbi:putative oxidoreductase [Novimethylophilus kurashikiensis]|uniref:Putative oxidoreductase n=1 Tax=Novimethylophilus kurashikiensis TaxID=1825523 RepID=A0A2R5FC22_9PROT|nr:DoxX family protein [Novimethylophilus kurashikiensis]GBG15750.1 putative oxidoreductase [Novimethylophilus kurashikiensis]